jgi:hypothetical protein
VTYLSPERFLLPKGGGAIVPSRVAAVIFARTDLARVKTEMRGADPEVDATLLALCEAALWWRSSVTGTADARTPEVPHPRNG